MSKNTMMNIDIKKNTCEGCGLYFQKKNEHQSHIKDCDFFNLKDHIEIKKKKAPV